MTASQARDRELAMGRNATTAARAVVEALAEVGQRLEAVLYNASNTGQKAQALYEGLLQNGHDHE